MVVREGHGFDLTLQELHVLHPGIRLDPAGQLQHLIGHIETICLAPRRHPLRREQDVDPTTAEVVHDLTRRELRQRYRAPASQRSLGGEPRQLSPLNLRVAPAGHVYLERTPLPRLRHTTTGRSAPATRTTTLLFRQHTPRRLGVPFPNSLLEPLVLTYSSYQVFLIQI